jgi:hypothetical protein
VAARLQRHLQQSAYFWRLAFVHGYAHRMSYILLIALIAGLLMNLLSPNAKVVELGRLTFFASVLALLIAIAPATVKLLQG